MEFSTFSQVDAVKNYKTEQDLINIRKLPKSADLKELTRKANEKMPEKNPFLDLSVRTLLDEFVLTWHKIFLDLLDPKIISGENAKGTEWWDYLISIFVNIFNVLWVKERIFYVGVGLIVISFFVFFIFATS